MVEVAANSEEDLREFYITPEYLDRLRERARDWDEPTIQIQLRLFHRTIPDYPEVMQILGGELHRRSLNDLKRTIRRWDVPRIEALLRRLESESERDDHVEVIETELAIRGGAKRLYDASGET